MFLPFIESGDEPISVTINIQANNPFPVGASGGFRENREPLNWGQMRQIIELASAFSLPDPRTLIRIRPLSTSI